MAAAKKKKKPVKLPKGYAPTEDEKFMNPKQKEYFCLILTQQIQPLPMQTVS